MLKILLVLFLPRENSGGRENILEWLFIQKKVSNLLCYKTLGHDGSTYTMSRLNRFGMPKKGGCNTINRTGKCTNYFKSQVHPKVCKLMNHTREIVWSKCEMLYAYLPTFHQFILSLQFCTYLPPPEDSMVLLCIDKYGLFCCRFNRQWYPGVCCTINLRMDLHENI